MSVVGVYKEIVELTEPVICEGNIEGWLKTLEEHMQSTMRDVCR